MEYLLDYFGLGSGSLMAADKADSVVIEVGSYMYYITVLQPDGEFYFGGLLPASF